MATLPSSFHPPFQAEVKITLGFRADVLPQLLGTCGGPGGVVRTAQIPVFPPLALLLGDQLVGRKVSHWIGEGA